MMKKNILSLIFNLTIVILGLIGVIFHYDGYALKMFQFYTLDSNVFLIIGCLICFVFNIKELTGKIDKIPDWVLNLKYMANCTTMVTFIVVIAVLSPMDVLNTGSIGKSYFQLLTMGGMLEHHLLCPLLGFLSLILFDEKPERNKKTISKALIFTIIYGVIVIILNILRVLEGPYPFLLVYEQPVYMSIIWVFIIIGSAYLIALLTYKIWFRKRNG